MITFKYYKSKPHTITIVNKFPDDVEIDELYIPHEINGEQVEFNIYNIIVKGAPLRVNTLKIAEGFHSFYGQAFKSIQFKNLVLPNSFNKLYPQMFTSTKSLETVYFPPDSNITAIPHGCFSYCTNLSKISLGKNISVICENAFYGCHSLSEFEFISEEELIIGAGAFQETSMLYSLDMSKWNLKIIHNYCFAHSALKTVKLPSVLEHIYGEAFYGTQLSSCTFPKNLQDIGISAFSHTRLTHIDVEEDAIPCTIYSRAFSCAAFSSLKIPANFKFVGTSHFSANENLMLVDFKESKINTISDSMFSNCNKLKRVKFNNNIIKIESSAFFMCNLKNIQLPSSIEEISDRAFGSTSFDLDSFEMDYFSEANISKISFQDNENIKITEFSKRYPFCNIVDT